MPPNQASHSTSHVLKFFHRSDAQTIAKVTGNKSSYSLMKLPNHNPLKQTMPDVMHTIKDVVEKLFGLITGKKDCEKVRQAERNIGHLTLQSKKVPYTLTKDQLHLADSRMNSIQTPIHIDFRPRSMFIKLGHMKSHDWKQVLSVFPHHVSSDML